VPGLIEDATKFAKAQGLPQFLERPDITERPCGFEFDHRLGRIQQVGSTSTDLEQSRNDGIEVVGDLVEAPKGRQGAVFRFPPIVSIGFYELEILAGARSGYLDEHASTI